jgi:RNA polymerase sigma factor (sigma-70 family)
MPPPAEGLASRLIVGPALRTQPDRRLVSLVREGYEAAFEEIVRRYGKPLARYAATIVGGRSEDVTQDAFSKALLALRRDDAEIELRPWLFRIVRNTALNDLRDRPPSPEALAEAIAGGRNPAEELERREELADLIRRLQALPEPQRAAIVMRELEGLGHEEIAAALGLSGGAARQAIYRARQALRNGLGMLLPLPLLRLLVDHGTEAAGGAGAVGGAAVATGATAGGGGALKAGAVVAVLAGSVGTGIALQEDRDGSQPARAAAGVSRALPTPDALPSASSRLALDRGDSSRSTGDGGSSGSPSQGIREGDPHRGELGDGHGRRRGRNDFPRGRDRPRHDLHRQGGRRGPGPGHRKRPPEGGFALNPDGRMDRDGREPDGRLRDGDRLRDGNGSYSVDSGQSDPPPPPPPEEEPPDDTGSEYEPRSPDEPSP